MHSIKLQCYKHWELLIISPKPVKLSALVSNDSRFKLIEDSSRSSFASILPHINGQFIIFLDNGIELPNYSLQCVALETKNQPNAKL